MSPKKVWITPAEAAEEMSRKAGYRIEPDDIKQMRHRGKIVRTKKLNERIILYHVDEIRNVTPPRKRHPKPFFNNLEKEHETGT